jgi:hypothetical protein
MLVGARHRGFSESAQWSGADGCRSDSGPAVVRVLYSDRSLFSHLALDARSGRVRKRNSITATQGFIRSARHLQELEGRLLVLAAVRKMTNPKHSHGSSLNVQEAHRPDCSAPVTLRPRGRLLHAGIELVSSSPVAVLVDLGG